MLFARLSYDQTSIQSSQTIYLDGGYMVSTGNYAELSRNFLYKNLTSFMVGLSYFSINEMEVLNWTFDVDLITTSGSMSYSKMALIYWNYRYRVCDPAFVFYNETDNKCYNQCDFYYFPVLAKSVCTPCHYSCYNCSNTSKTHCTLCSAGDFRTLSTGNQCKCNSGYYDNGIALCASCYYSCLTCNSSSYCLTCPSAVTSHRVYDNNGKCPCSDPYFDSGTAICSTCIDTISACTKCTSTTVCTQCNSTLFYTVQGNICDCIDQYTEVSSVCNKCSTFMDGCVTCSGTSICTSCDSSEFFQLDLTAQKCICQAGYFKNNTQCDLCFETIHGCSVCSSNSVCTTCDSSKGFVTSGSICICTTGMYLNLSVSPTTCSPCSIITNCLTCTNHTYCTSCNPLQHFVSILGQCLCMQGYYLHSGMCVNITCTKYCDNCICQCKGYENVDGKCTSLCGDGYLVKEFEQCDDGNHIEMDGCSRDCQIETGFKCVEVGDKSECSYAGVLNVSLISFEKDSYSNTLLFVLKIQPELYSLNYLNFSDLILSNLPVDNASYSYFNGTLQITYQFNTSLDKQQMIFTITPSSNSNFTQSASTIIQIPLILNSNQPIIPYSPWQYQTRILFQKIYTVTMIGSYFTLLLSLFTNKVVGIEMMGVLQVAFFALADYDFLHPLMAPLRSAKYVNGYNFKLVNDQNKGVPIPLKAIDYNQYYLSNINVMLCLPVMYLVTSLLLHLIGTLKKDLKNKHSLIKWSKNMLKQYLLTSVMFSVYNIGFSFGLQVKYSVHPDVLNILSNVVSFVLIVVVIYLLIFRNDEHFGEFKLKFKQSLFARNYILIKILTRALTGFLMSHQHHNPIITIINTFISIIFLLYQIIDLPFNDGYHNYRTIFCQSSVIMIFFITMYYRSMKINVPIQVKGMILEPSYVLIGVIGYTILVSLAVLCYEIIQSIKNLSRIMKEKKEIERKELVMGTIEGMNVSDYSQIRLD